MTQDQLLSVYQLHPLHATGVVQVGEDTYRYNLAPLSSQELPERSCRQYRTAWDARLEEHFVGKWELISFTSALWLTGLKTPTTGLKTPTN